MSTRVFFAISAILVAICTSITGPVTISAHEGLDRDIERETGVLIQNPTDVEALIRRALYFRLDGQLSQSLADLDRAREIDPGNLGVTFQRGLTLSALGHDEEAEEELSLVLARGSGNAAAFSERAKIRARGGRVELAISDLNAAIAREPGLDLYLERGRLWESHGRLAEAAKGYRDGLDRLGEALLLRRALVRVEMARKRHGDALRMIDEQIDKGWPKTEWYLKRAEVLDAMGRPADAERARFDALSQADRVLRERPTSANLVARAEVHLALGDVAAARRDLEQGLRNSPQMERARAMLSAIEGGPDAR